MEKKHKSHPQHRGGGMSEFNKGHWQKKVDEVDMSNRRYASEMGAAEEYKKSVDRFAKYASKHRAEH